MAYNQCNEQEKGKKKKSNKERKTHGEKYMRYTFRYNLSADGTLV